MEKYTSKLNISKLLDSKGNNKILWVNLLKDIISGDNNLNYNMVSKLNQCLIDNENLELAIDIIDFIVDYGADSLIESIATKDFLKNFNHILSVNYKSDKETKKLVLFLIKKWANKYKEKEAFHNFKENENLMIKKGMFTNFDERKKYETYLKYITSDEINEKINNFSINLNSEETVLKNPFIDTIVEAKPKNVNINIAETLTMNEEAPPCLGVAKNSYHYQLPDNINNTFNSNNEYYNETNIGVVDINMKKNNNIENQYNNKQSFKILNLNYFQNPKKESINNSNNEIKNNINDIIDNINLINNNNTIKSNENNDSKLNGVDNNIMAQNKKNNNSDIISHNKYIKINNNIMAQNNDKNININNNNNLKNHRINNNNNISNHLKDNKNNFYYNEKNHQNDNNQINNQNNQTKKINRENYNQTNYRTVNNINNNRMRIMDFL